MLLVLLLLFWAMTDLVPRSGWGADNVKLDPMPKKPVDTVFLHHTATPATSDGAKDMRNVEAGEQARGYTTVAYTECGHPDGKVYEGRGISHKGAATLNWNSKSLAYCLIGNYQTLVPSTVALESCAQRLALWVRNGAVTKDFVLRPHSDVFATACCGTNLKPHIPAIRERVKQILDGGQPAPNPGGVLVTTFKSYSGNIKTDDQGNGWTEILHDGGRDPSVAIASLNGTNPAKEGYTKIGGCALAAAKYDGTRVIVSLIGGTPRSGTGINLLLGW